MVVVVVYYYLLARSLFFFSFLTMNQNEIEIKYF